MKYVALLTVCILATVCSEPYCDPKHPTRGCDHITCDNANQQVGCQHYICTCVDHPNDRVSEQYCGEIKPSADGGCDENIQGCGTQSDCTSYFDTHHHPYCSHSSRHCIDKKCTCMST